MNLRIGSASSIGATTYVSYVDEETEGGQNIHLAKFSEDFAVAWSRSRNNIKTIKHNFSDLDDLINIRVCILPYDASDKESLVCCMAITAFNEKRYMQWGRDERPTGFDIFARRNFIETKIGVDPAVVASKMAALKDGKLEHNSDIYVDVLRNPHYVKHVFFSDGHFDVIKKVTIASIAANVLARSFVHGVVQPATLPRPKDVDRINRIKTIIEQNLSRAPSINEIAEEVGVSPSKLLKMFRDIEKKTIGDFILERKMLLAASLLTSRSISVAEVGYRSGYEHPSNFTTAFRKYFGVSPRAYQKANLIR
jgi:AraC-like DNA-binding protein